MFKVKMKSWKTTLSGILMSIPVILAAIGINIPTEVSQIITATGGLLLGATAKDHNVTGK